MTLRIVKFVIRGYVKTGEKTLTQYQFMGRNYNQVFVSEDE